MSVNIVNIADKFGTTGLLNGLVAYWKLDETSGQALDSHSTHDSSTVSVTIQGDTGKIGTSYNFVWTSSNYVSIPSHDDFNFSSGVGVDVPFSVSYWINIPAEPRAWNGIIVRNETGGTNAQWAIEYEHGVHKWTYLQLFTNASDIIQAYTGYDLAGVGWTHFVITYDGLKDYTHVKIYINSELHTTYDLSVGTYTGMSNTASDPISLGRWQTGDYLSGNLDEIGVWKNRVLTEAEVSTLYNGGDGLAYPFS